MSSNVPTRRRKGHVGETLWRLISALALLVSLLGTTILTAAPVGAAAGSYSLKWYAADPAVNRAPYLPTYTKVKPSQLACPTPSGGTGRAADPMKDAVAYGSSFTSNQLDAVTSLAPKDLALGQIVPFEMEISVSGSTTPENGVIKFTTGFNTHTTSGDNFGYDPNYMIYCAFVDTLDKGTVDPGANAKVDSWTSTLANPGGGSNEEIQGTFQVSGLNSGDNVIVEIWVVLKPTIPAGSSGNVQTRLISANTVAASPATISTGNQTVPLLRVKEFFTSDADLSLTKSDSPDPVTAGSELTYTLTVTNNSTDTIANGVVVTDTLDPNTTFVSGSWSGGTCTSSSGTVTCNVGALSPGQSVAITIKVTVNSNAPTTNDTSTNAETGTCTAAGTGIDLCNKASVTAITNDPNTANNSASQPTNVVPAAAPALTLDKTADPTSYSTVGDVISYSYVLENTGNVTLSAPFAVSDDKTTVSCPATPTSLAPGDTITCTASYTIKQADVDAGSVTNTATATAKHGTDTVTSNEDKATVTATTGPAITLTKTATPKFSDPVKVGDTIDYTLVAENTGNVTLNNVSISDPLLGTLSCTPDQPATLAPGASLSCTGTYTLTLADIEAGKVDNTATATSKQPDGSDGPSDQDSADVPVTQNPHISLTKDVTETTFTQSGDVLHYTLVATNDGNVTLSDVSISDPLLGTLSCDKTAPVSLAPGEKLTCTGSYTVQQSDVDAGKVDNTATAKGTFGGNDYTDTASQEVTSSGTASISLTKTADKETVNAEDNVGFIITVKNDGTATAHGVTVTDTLPTNSGLDWSIDPAVSGCAIADGELTCNFGDLGPGASASVHISSSTTAATCGAVDNTAKATSSNDGSAEASDSITVNCADVTVSKTGNGPINAGDTATFAIVVSNSGQGTAHNVALADSLPAGLDWTIDPAVTGCAIVDGVLSCTFPSLASGASATIKVSASTNAQDCSPIENTVSVSASNEADTTNDSASASIFVNCAALTLDKSATESSFSAAGDVIHYSYKLTNSGNVTLDSPFTITDDKSSDAACPDTPASLAPGDSITCTGSYEITQADVDAGSVTNTATGHGFFGSTAIDSNEDSVTVDASQAPALTLDKTVTSEGPYDSVGDAITYQLVATNTGNVTLHDVSISDPLLGTLTCTQPVDLAPSATLTCTGAYLVTQDDLDAGHVANTGTAVSDETDPATDDVDVPLAQNPAISLVKSVEETSFAKAGDVLHYTLVATNDGNVTLTNVSITDPLLGELSCSQGQPAILAPANMLAPGESLTCTGTYTVQQSDVDAGKVDNTATATGTFDGKEYTDTDSKSVPSTGAAHITLTKTATPHLSDPAKVGDIIDYTLVATNDGDVTLNNASISDPLLPSLDCTPAQPATLAPGDSLSCTGSYAITQADIDAGKVANTALATSNLPGGGDGPSDDDSEDVTIPQSPAISLSKSADPTTYDAVDQTITYSYVITNTGNVTLAGPFAVTDDKATVTCDAAPAGGLAPQATLNCTATYTITQADLDAGEVTNTATASTSFDGKDVTSDPATATVTATQSPALTIVKLASPSTYGKVGDVINYSYTVTNSGNVTLFNISVVDDKVTVTCPDTSAGLAPQASITCTASHTITQDDLDAGSITNSAYATDGTTQSDPDEETVTAEQAPDLTLDKTVTSTGPYDSVGDAITYQLVATNTGNVTLHNVSISDPLLGTLTCTQPVDLAPSATLTCTGAYLVTQDDLDAGHVANTGTADSNETEPVDDKVDEPLAQNPAISLTKSVTETSFANAGDVLHYTLVAENTGNVTLSNVAISDPLLGTLSCDKTAPVSLAPGESLSCTGSYTVLQSDVDAGKVHNTATATGSFDGKEYTDTDSKSVPASQSAALSLTKTADPTTYGTVGDVISYSYVLKNTGNVTLTSPFAVTDDKATVSCPATPTSLAPGDTITCTASYTITQADLNAGSVTNTATATAKHGTDTVTSNEDKATVTATQNPAISLTKSVTETSFAKVGDVLHYTLVATNSGNVTLTNVSISDPLLGTLSCTPSQPTTLAPNATLSCTGTYTVKLSDLDAGKVDNTATATGTFGGKDYTDTDSKEVTATQSPAITLSKSASPTTYSKIGDVISYTLVAKNTGNVTLHDVSISDPLLGTLNCTPSQPATLKPGDSLSCTGSYTIQASDLVAGQVNRVTNTATVNGKGPQDQPVSATASATVYQQAAALVPTQTTCQMYASGSYQSAEPFSYVVKGNKINSVSPGVVFYYNTITAPSASFTLSVVQNNSLGWKPMLVQDLGQAILYTSNCTKASGVTVSTTNNPYTVKFTVTGATAGATYYIGIKYSPQNLIGQSVSKSGGVYPTSIYSFETTGYANSKASIPVQPKK